MSSALDELREDRDRLTPLLPNGIDVALILGSGLGAVLAGLLEDERTLPYRDLPGMPTGHVEGHTGQLHIGTLHGKTIAAFAGRSHLYQGVAARKVVHAVRLAASFGVKAIVLTNAAGGISQSAMPGRLMLIADHINLTGTTPLDFSRPLCDGMSFLPMLDAYSPRLRALAKRAASFELHEGVYAGVLGPEYETPAYANYLRTIGADAVGMSTVLETIAARALGLEVLGVSLITNIAATADTHEAVLTAAASSEENLRRLLHAILVDSTLLT